MDWKIHLDAAELTQRKSRFRLRTKAAFVLTLHEQFESACLKIRAESELPVHTDS